MTAARPAQRGRSFAAYPSEAFFASAEVTGAVLAWVVDTAAVDGTEMNSVVVSDKAVVAVVAAEVDNAVVMVAVALTVALTVVCFTVIGFAVVAFGVVGAAVVVGFSVTV